MVLAAYLGVQSLANNNSTNRQPTNLRHYLSYFVFIFRLTAVGTSMTKSDCLLTFGITQAASVSSLVYQMFAYLGPKNDCLLTFSRTQTALVSSSGYQLLSHLGPKVISHHDQPGNLKPLHSLILFIIFCQ